MLAQGEAKVPWETAAPDFASEGALRDVYVAATTRADWQRALDFVRERCTDITYAVDSEHQPIPARIDEAFATHDRAAVTLTFRFGPIHFATHFFVDDELEFDFWPKDVQGQHELDALLDFIRQLGDVLGKPVAVSFESSRETTFLVYEPTSQRVRYVPSASDRNA